MSIPKDTIISFEYGDLLKNILLILDTPDLSNKKNTENKFT